MLTTRGHRDAILVEAAIMGTMIDESLERCRAAARAVAHDVLAISDAG